MAESEVKYSISIESIDTVVESRNEESILESALSSNIHLEHSCKNGDCGICEAELVTGVVSNELGEEQREGTFLTCCSIPLCDIKIRANYFPELENIVKKTLPVKVDKIKVVADEIILLTLRLPPTVDFQYLAGQYIELNYKGVIRSYSIANSKDIGTGIELHIRRLDSGKMSELLFSDLQLNVLMRISGPHGTFFIRESDAPIIFLAGGTGFAPVKAMVEDLLKASSKRQVYIYWGMRSKSGFYSDFAQEVQLGNENITYIPVVSDKDSDWIGREGLVHQAVLDDFSDLSKFDVYACGSPQMIEVAKAAFIEIGLAKKKFYSDAFISTEK